MKKYRLALFIGRFQPFHKGHLYSLEKAMEVSDRVMVGIGSSNESRTKSNPWSYEERVKMVREVINNYLRGPSSQVKIVGIPDYPGDGEWAEEVLRLVKKEGYQPDEVVVVGNNDWTNEVLRSVGMSVLETGLHNRNKLEGVKIREMMRNGDEKWRERVLKCVGGDLDLRALGC